MSSVSDCESEFELHPAHALPAEFQCSVCQSWLKDMRTTPCGHSFCQACLAAWIKKAPGGKTADCPLCRQPVTLKQCTAILRVEERARYEAALLRCTACQDAVRIGDLAGHRAACRVPCSHADCPERVLRAQLAAHARECSYRTIGCTNDAVSFLLKPRPVLHLPPPLDSVTLLPVEVKRCTWSGPLRERDAHLAADCAVQRQMRALERALHQSSLRSLGVKQLHAASPALQLEPTPYACVLITRLSFAEVLQDLASAARAHRDDPPCCAAASSCACQAPLCTRGCYVHRWDFNQRLPGFEFRLQLPTCALLRVATALWETGDRPVWIIDMPRCVHHRTSKHDSEPAQPAAKKARTGEDAS